MYAVLSAFCWPSPTSIAIRGTNIYHPLFSGCWEDDFPLPAVGYVSSQEGSNIAPGRRPKGPRRETHLNQPQCFRCKLLVSGKVYYCHPYSTSVNQVSWVRFCQFQIVQVDVGGADHTRNVALQRHVAW